MLGFIIIWGSRGITTTVTRGRFFCPSCGSEGGYAHMRVRNFFTLYFIPLIPMNVAGEYIECQRCRGTFDKKVLRYDPAEQEEFEAEFQKAMKRVMVLMMMADGVIDEDEVTTIQDLYEKISGKRLSKKGVQKEIERAEKRGTDVEAALGEVAPGLNAKGKEMVIRAALAVAAADGIFQDEEKELLMEIAEVLQVRPRKLKKILGDVMEPAG